VLSVSTESLAVLAATVGGSEHAHWLLDAALVPLGLGLAFYVFVISCFDLHQLAIEGVDPLADRDVITQHSGDKRIVRVTVGRVGGQKHLLLQPEVHSPVPLPVRDQRGPGLGCRLGARAAQLNSAW
jgi:hypothetical protein